MGIWEEAIFINGVSQMNPANNRIMGGMQQVIMNAKRETSIDNGFMTCYEIAVSDQVAF